MTKCTRSDTSSLKKVEFHRAARKEIQGFPYSIRRSLGEIIRRLQLGKLLTLPLSRSIRAVGAGAEELRMRDSSGSYRVFYLARLRDRIMVFHAFQKKTAKTQRREIETGKRRLREMRNA